ncbi:CYTH domain-containing protein [Tamilnaduibacter salinus]|uniref:CYTH domain-containing protein n=1 Tax=Tamilnaduibacter salinus TaxID=1484056 RepID=A0A2U1CU96_9GAMM|nr:CYTH domain-containing protein [Tamilnaduibacter salinus]PVY70333.1 CYTH domain-containing protein [Tamilnaduibacter salinus]
MAEELEIKLSVQPTSETDVLDWLSGVSGASARAQSLRNTYFDTPGADLNRQRAALRLRQKGERIIQTLKTQGEFVDGAHRRQEWEWDLDAHELSLGRLTETPLSSGVPLDQLRAVFETNFTRYTGVLATSGSSVECVLDSGWIVAGDVEWPLHEVEFEHQSGDKAQLLEWARRLAKEVPVMLNLISKAEQGYWLAGLHTPAPLDDVDPVTRWLSLLSVAWLTHDIPEDLAAATDGVHDRAVERGVEANWEWFREALADGRAVHDLAVDGRLGRLQLAFL